MSRFEDLTVSMTRGEVTPLVQSRVDIQDYKLGLKTCENWVVSKYGGITRIPGTTDLAACATATSPSRLMPFIFNQQQGYALEFSNLEVRFFTPDGQSVDALSVPIFLTTPYTQSDLWNIQISSIGDVIYVTCAGYAPRVITRTGDTSDDDFGIPQMGWTIEVFVPKRGPWLPSPMFDPKAWMVWPIQPSLGLGSPSGHAIPDMTSLTAPSGTVTSDPSTAGAWNLFARKTNVATNFARTGAGWVQYDYGAGNSATIIAYKLSAPHTSADTLYTPTHWVIEGKGDGGITWITLDEQTVVDWVGGEERVFEIVNELDYRYYRLRWKNNGIDTSGAAKTFWGLWEPLAIEAEQTALTINLGAEGVNYGDNGSGIFGWNGITAADIGRSFRVLSDDGYYRELRITAVTSSFFVDVKVVGPAPLHTDDTGFLTGFKRWQLDAWNQHDGYPSAVTRYKGRLGFFRTPSQPRTGWLSGVNDYTYFGTSQPTLLDDDAVTFSLSQGAMDEILWATSNGDDLLLGTVGGIRVVGQRDNQLPFSPSNNEETGNTEVRAGAVQPVWVDKVMIFANKQLKKLYETAFSLDDGGYISRELSMLAEHIFKQIIRELHVSMEPEPTIWAVLENGQVGVCTYDRQQQVFGVSRLKVPGTSASVQSMCIIPDDGYDVPMLCVGRKVNGTITYRVEKMLDPFRNGNLSSDVSPLYLMSSATYSGADTSTITGLGHLEGETVGVYDYDHGIDLGDAVVSSGQITVPGGGTVTDVFVGLRYTSTFGTLRPPNVPLNDNRTSSSFITKPMNIIDVTADVYETYGLYMGGDSNTHLLTTEEDRALGPVSPALHTGRLKVPSEEGWSYDTGITGTTDSAYPATVRALVLNIDRGT